MPWTPVAVVLFAAVSRAAPKTVPYTLLSVPSGASVYDQLGNSVCLTPCEVLLHQAAFRAPLFVFDRYLDTVVGYVFSKEGYESQTVVITEGPFRFSTMDRSTQYNYYLVRSRQATAHLVSLRLPELSSPAIQPCAVGFGRAADGNCYPIVAPVAGGIVELGHER